MKRIVLPTAALQTFAMFAMGACSTAPARDPVEMSEQDLLAQISLVPTSATTDTGIVGKGCSSPYWSCVDDGTAYGKSDDGKTVAQIDSATSGTHTLGFSGGPTGAVGAVTVYYRASLTTSKITGTIQVQLYDGTKLLGTGKLNSLGSAWANFSDTFSGLNVASVNALRTTVLLKRGAGTGQAGYTMLWITATGVGYCATDADCSGSTPKCNTTTHVCGCVPGAKQCNALQPQTCDSTGTWQNSGTACTGTCQACTAGSCTLVTGAPPAGKACSGSGTCGGSCNGQSASCTYPGPSTICGAPVCTNGTVTNVACNGAGGCSTPIAQSCNGFPCSGNQCATTCTNRSTTGCQSGFKCVGGNTCVAASVPCGLAGGTSCSIAGGGGCCVTDSVDLCAPSLSACTGGYNAGYIPCNSTAECPTGQSCCIKGNNICSDIGWTMQCTSDVTQCTGGATPSASTSAILTSRPRNARPAPPVKS